MDLAQLETEINAAWDARDNVTVDTKGAVRDAVVRALDMLDSGSARVAEPLRDHQWQVNQWLKKAVLLSFRLNAMQAIPSGTVYQEAGESVWWDKIAPKFSGWDDARFKAAGFRAVPGCIVRHSAYIAPNAVLMPSFVNLGAYIGSGTMVDTWATVGSCAQIGQNVHLSGGAGIGGVLEPLRAGPVIIEDDCFIGARSEVVEGVVVERGAVLSMGVFIGASTRLLTGLLAKCTLACSSLFCGCAWQPSWQVAGRWSPGPSLYCAVIIKKVDEKTRAKTSVNDLLRD